jgi:hypothetical protein
MKTAMILIAALAVGAAAPALAAKGDAGNLPKITYDAKHDKFCVSQQVTGYTMPVKDCRTQSDWAKAGVTVSKPADPNSLASK